MTLLLETRNVSKSYGAFHALEQVSMVVHQGELVSVVGPNGAGKTTLVNLLTGLIEPSSSPPVEPATPPPLMTFAMVGSYAGG